MTQHDDASRLRHMLDAAEKAVGFSKGRGRGDLDAHEQLTLALTRLIEIIGEAAKNVSEVFRGQHPEVPWRDIAGMRDRLAHGYFDIDLDVLWQTITTRLPELIAQLKKLVA